MSDRGRDRWLAVGALLAALSVGAGAFGTHGLQGRLDARGLELWEIGARYLMYTGLALMAVGLASGRLPPGARRLVAQMLTVGAAILCGTVLAMAIGAPNWLGAVTPVGGVLLIAGLLALAVAAWRGP